MSLFQASGTTKSPEPRFPSTAQFTNDTDDVRALKRADLLAAQVTRGPFVESDMVAPDAPSRRG